MQFLSAEIMYQATANFEILLAGLTKPNHDNENQLSKVSEKEEI